MGVTERPRILLAHPGPVKRGFPLARQALKRRNARDNDDREGISPKAAPVGYDAGFLT